MNKFSIIFKCPPRVVVVVDFDNNAAGLGAWDSLGLAIEESQTDTQQIMLNMLELVKRAPAITAPRPVFNGLLLAHKEAISIESFAISLLLIRQMIVT